MCKTIEKKPYAKEQEVSFDEFVDSLFAFAKNPQGTCLSVQREDGHLTRIVIIHVDRTVIAKMDDVVMGNFEPYAQQG